MEYKGSSGAYTLEAQPMKAGGEGSIYRIQNHTDMVAKIYHPEKISSELEDKIIYMTNNPPDHTIMNQIAWPQDVLRDRFGNFVGFVMPKLAIDTDLKAIYTYPPNPKIPITYEQKVIVGINICIVISAIHKAGYVFGDFNPLNIGVNLTTGHVAFLDKDSYHITDKSNGTVYRCSVCLDGYVAPELIQHCKGTDFSSAPLPTFTQETDRFALAIHIFKLLMNGYTPFNGIKEGESASQASPGVGNLAIERDNYCFKPGNKPQSVATPELTSLTPDIQYLFKKTFLGGVNNPNQRATADEWYQALCEYKDNIIPCANDKTHFYYINNADCPYCEADKRYKQGMSRTTGSYRTNSQGNPHQVNFGNPVNVPPTTNSKSANYNYQTLNSQQSANKSALLKRVLLWIFLFPVMLTITICKSKMRLIAKILLVYMCWSISLSTIGGIFLYIGDIIAESSQSYSDGKNNSSGSSGKENGSNGVVIDGNFQYTENSTGYTISLAPGKSHILSGIVDIPSAYKGTTVTAIAENGFSECVNVTSFVVPKTVTSIGYAAFKGCDNLESIMIPFVGKSQASDRHESVFGYIFGYEIVSADYSNMGFGTNDGFKNIKPVNIPETTWQFSYYNYAGVLENEDTYYKHYYYYIPQKLNSVVISLQTDIPTAAFNGCSNLTSIRYMYSPDTKANIGEAAFQNCSSLVEWGVFENSTGKLNISNNVINIGDYAFAGCKGFTEIFVSDTVRSIGKAAFKGCDNIQNISIPFIGKTETAETYEAVFGYIFGYESIESKENHTYNTGFLNEKPVDILGEIWQYTSRESYSKTKYYYYIPQSITSVTITKQTTIPTAAFNGCSNISKITYTTMLSDKTDIGEAAFQNCTSLVFEGDDGGKLELNENISNIGAYAFAGCKNITEVIVPDTVRSIGVAAFKDCDNIRSMTLPFVGKTETAETYEAVFGYIFGYESIESKENHTYNIGFLNEKPVDILGETWQYTLRESYSKTQYYYYIPQSITSVKITKQTAIPTAAFNGCSNIKTLTVSANADLGEYALQNCNATIIRK